MAYPLQNFISWQPGRFFGVKAGRQQLSFGSERVIGVSDWNYRSRVFDGGRLDLSYKAHLLSVFQMDVNNDSGGAKPFGGKHQFSGVYLALKTLILMNLTSTI